MSHISHRVHGNYLCHYLILLFYIDYWFSKTFSSMPLLASCPLCISVGVKSSCLSEMLAPQQRDTYTLFMVRWLCWKQDLSHINHKRFELGQDRCKGTEIRQCILYTDTLQKENVPHARKKWTPPFCSKVPSFLKLLKRSYSPCGDALMAESG